MLGLGLRQLQDALNRKADEVQREFLEVSEKIEEINAEILEEEGDRRKELLARQRDLRDQQHDIAEEINVWRERARSVIRTGGSQTLRKLLEELSEIDEPPIRKAVERAQRMLDFPEEAQAEHTYADQPDREQTAAGRLLERARTEYDLRAGDSAARRRAASEFANRPGVAQNDELLEEVAVAVDDTDPLVRELATLTLIQLHRFRAMRFADLDLAHNSVQELVKMRTPEVVPVLAEILKSHRTGFTQLEGDEEPTEASNKRSRMVALLRLVEWHTPEAKSAVQSVQFDKEEEIGRAAKHALEVFPGPWSGPLKRSKEE